MDILHNKGTIYFKGTTPIYKQTNDTRFSVPSMVSKYISQNEWDINANHWNEHVCMCIWSIKNVKALF